MAPSLSIAAYLAGRGASGDAAELATQPPRPEGAIIWARCSHPDQLTAVETLNRKLGEDGDPVQVVTTLSNWDVSMATRSLPEPQGKENIRSFIGHWRPDMAIWVQGNLDPILLDEMRFVRLPCMLVDADAGGIEQVTGSWVPGVMRSLLSQFEWVLAVDQAAAERLIRAGTPHQNVRVTGAMEDCGPALPYHESEYQEVARIIGTRPVWLAAAAWLKEWRDICRAHKQASSGAHRLLLVIVPEDPWDADEFAANMRDDGFQVALRSKEPEPKEHTQVYIIDTEGELGLWYRIAPITYLGGTLYGDCCRDPFEAAALGSAVIYGSQTAPFQKHATRLHVAGASHLLGLASSLGPAVEMLLSADKAAVLAHAAWDVTSRGADVTNRIVDIIQQRLEKMGR